MAAVAFDADCFPPASPDAAFADVFFAAVFAVPFAAAFFAVVFAVADPGIAPARPAEDADHQGALRPRVVRDLDHRFLLDHLAALLACALDDLDHAPPLVL